MDRIGLGRSPRDFSFAEHRLRTRLVAAALASLAAVGMSLLTAGPTPASAQACDPGGGFNARTVEFANVGTTSVEARWVNFQCGETFYSTVRGGGSYLQQTYVSHLWRFYEVGTGKLLKEERIGSQTRIEFGDPSSVTTTQPAAAPTTVAAALANPTPVFPGAGNQRTRLGNGPCTPGGGTDRADVTFRNKGTTTVEVWWVNFQCGETLYATLPAGAEYVQQTYKTHQWKFYEAPAGPASTTLCTVVQPPSSACLRANEPGGGSVLYQTDTIGGQTIVDINTPPPLDAAWQPKLKATVSGTRVTFRWAVTAGAGSCVLVRAEVRKGTVAQQRNEQCMPVGIGGAESSLVLTLDPALIKRQRQSAKPVTYVAQVTLLLDGAHGGAPGLPAVVRG